MPGLGRIAWTGLTAILLTGPMPVAAQTPEPTAPWPQFRGPNASGVADGHPLPTTWNAADGTNIRWKTPIVGLGHSCPIVWGDRLFVTTAVSGKKEPYFRHGLYGDVQSVSDDTPHTWHVFCLDRRDGKVLWEREAYLGVPKFKRHMKATHANSTPVTDGRHVVACFGAEGLYCYDFEGNLKWQKELGPLESGWYMASKDEWGFGSSPIIHDGRVILLCDVQKDPFIAAFDVHDGREIWRTARQEVCTWGSPTVVKSPQRTEIVVNGHRQIAGYDPQSGALLWQMKGAGDIPTPTPIFAHGLIFMHSSHGMGSPIFAVRPGASGDITLKGMKKSNEFIVWSHERGGPYMPTGIAYGEYYYTPDDRGVITCYQPLTGERVYRKRVADGAGGGYTASPVAGDGKLYLTSEDGEIFVIKAGSEYELLAQNSLGEPCLATPAISGGVIYFRTLGNIVAVGM